MIRFTLLFLLILCVISIGCKDLSNSSESGMTIVSVKPAQVSQGEANVKGKIQGTNFVAPLAVSMGEGIKISNTEILSATEISILFSVSENAAPGARKVQVANSRGMASFDGLTVKENRAPLANFSIDPAQGGRNTIYTFDGSSSLDPDGSIQAYDWNFGDNRSASGKKVTHQFGTPGNFNVTLTVTDDKQGKGSSARDVQVAENTSPIAKFSVNPSAGDSTTPFEFDGSSSADSDGQIVDYFWEFGDGGSSHGKMVNHKFQKKKEYNVNLTVTDDGGLKGVANKEVRVFGQKPIVQFSVSPEDGDPGTLFRFNATGSNDPDGRIVEYRWDFGDGRVRKGDKRIDHKFDSTGTYRVELQVTDNDGLENFTDRHVAVRSSGGGGGDGGGPAEGKCTQPSKYRIAHLFKVLEHNQSAKTLVGKFFEDVSCNDVFYLCGDVRLGGYNGGPGPEYWIGTICQMESLGNNTFKMWLVGGKSWVTVGEDRTYVWPQLDCDPHVHCTAFGY